MPELPEVETTTRKLQRLTGKTISSFWGNWPRGLRVAKSARITRKDIAGRKVEAISRRGKAVIFSLSEDRTLAFHQRMSGKLFIPHSRLNQSKHIHVKIFFTDQSQLLFQDPRKFGVVWYGKPEQVFADKYFKNMGPDALSISKAEFIARLGVRRGMVKAMLLKQSFIAGVGNIVADETLWKAKIHPKRRVEDLSRLGKNILYRALQHVLRSSIEAQGTTLRDWRHPDGASGRFQNQLNVYGRNGEQCRRCGQKIMRIVVASRGTWVCAQCQPLSLGFKWIQEGARIVGPENVREQFRFAYDTINGLEGIARQVCTAREAEEATTDSFFQEQRRTQRLAYENNYFRIQENYDARMQDTFRAGLVAPDDVPKIAPTLEQMVVLVCPK